MSENTRTCCIPNGQKVSTFTLLATPTIASNSSQIISQTQQLTQWIYVSTLEATKKVSNPNYSIQYTSQTDRINAKLGRLSLGSCN
jgi:hypothetical protein